ncbi:MAG: methylated-DNA--[protein]-cysteine S-methyltransferase [Candidatus Electrothrix sp. AR4]|nr:methylated-DNA--[protein]-cysteine S-methyltransferase [Candidatus Electrothrix sp. AR4]
MHSKKLNTPLGVLHLFADNSGLHRIVFPASASEFPEVDSALEEHPVLTQATTQLTEYFNGSRQHFDLPLPQKGTAFQQAVWKYIAQIPYGETRSYGAIAAKLGNRNKARAVGGAANKNPLPIVIPCHRVVGNSGRLTGFSGGLARKQFLLILETKRVQVAEKPSDT